MTRWPALFLFALLAAAAAPPPPPPAGRTLIGRYGGWAAFRDAAPAACFAIASPRERDRGETPPFLAFTRRPGLRAPAELHLRLSRARDIGQPVVLRVGGSAFSLLARGDEAWAASARDDARILAALRGPETIEVAATGVHGHAFSDVYPLAGAPSAIDAAILACVGA